jgi:hypothetical protein
MTTRERKFWIAYVTWEEQREAINKDTLNAGRG